MGSRNLLFLVLFALTAPLSASDIQFGPPPPAESGIEFSPPPSTWRLNFNPAEITAFESREDEGYTDMRGYGLGFDLGYQHLWSDNKDLSWIFRISLGGMAGRMNMFSEAPNAGVPFDDKDSTFGGIIRGEVSAGFRWSFLDITAGAFGLKSFADFEDAAYFRDKNNDGVYEEYRATISPGYQGLFVDIVSAIPEDLDYEGAFLRFRVMPWANYRFLDGSEPLWGAAIALHTPLDYLLDDLFDSVERTSNDRSGEALVYTELGILDGSDGGASLWFRLGLSWRFGFK